MNKDYIPWIRNALIVGVVLLPLPLAARILLIVSMVYWFGPFVLYFTQRMPAVAMVERVPDSASIPPKILHHLEQMLPPLRDLGFVELARLQSANSKSPAQGLLVLLQHPTASDTAHVLLGQSGQLFSETLVFSRPRSDGSRLTTLAYTLRSPFPPAPQDNTLRLSGTRPPADLWRIHQARVQDDPTVTRNPRIDDGVAFQIRLETEGIERHVRSGYWQRDPGALFLRPTPRGALLMTLRARAPWKQLDAVRARLALRRQGIHDPGPTLVAPWEEHA